MQQQKRVLDLPRFVRALADAGQAVDFRVYGEGPDRPALDAALRDAGVSGSVRFEGALPRSELCKALTRENFILFCSEYEGLPLSMLEACARGVVPVATDIRSGIGDLLADGRDAVLYPVGEPETGAKKLLALLAKPGGWESLRAATQEAGRRFEFQACLKDIVAALGDAAKHGKVPADAPPSKRATAWTTLRERMARR
jgi:glycosyltransferase involved in cell wall biosynthesis